MIKAISFDLDGTLADERFDDLIWREEIPILYAKKYKLSIERAKEKVFSTYYVAYYIEKEPRWRDIEYWINRFKLGDWKKVVDGLKDQIFIYSDVIPTLKQLKEKYKLLVISGADEKFLKLKIDTLSLKPYLDHIYSGPTHFGVLGKGVRVYAGILKELKLKPTEVVHIGDNHEQDYLVPRTIGMHAFHLMRGKKRKGKYEISTLREVAEKIEDLS